MEPITSMVIFCIVLLAVGGGGYQLYKYINATGTSATGTKKAVTCIANSSTSGTGAVVPKTSCKCLNDTSYYLENGKCFKCPENSLISATGLPTPFNNCKCTPGKEWNRNVNRCLNSCPSNSSYYAPSGKTVTIIEGQPCNCNDPDKQFIVDGTCVNCSLNSVSTSVEPNGVITNRPECRCPLEYNSWDPVMGCVSSCGINASLNGPGRSVGSGCNCISSADMYVTDNKECKFCPTGTSTNYNYQGSAVPNTGERDSSGNIIINNGTELNPCRCPSNSNWDANTNTCRSCPAYSSFKLNSIPDVVDIIGTDRCYCDNSGSNANKVYYKNGTCKYCPGNSTLDATGVYIDNDNACKCPPNSMWNGTTCSGICPQNSSTTGTGSATGVIVNGSICNCYNKDYYLDTVGCSKCPIGSSTDPSYTGGNLSGKYSSCRCATDNGPNSTGDGCVTQCTANATTSSTATGSYVNVAIGSQAQYCRCLNSTDIFADNETTRTPPANYLSTMPGGFCTKCPSGSNRLNTGPLVPEYNNMCRCALGKYFNNRENSCTDNTCTANAAIDATGEALTTTTFCESTASVGSNLCLGTVPCRCNGDYYINNNACVACPANSSTLAPTNKPTVPNTLNKCRCKSGYYLNSSNQCVSCPNNTIDRNDIPSDSLSIYTPISSTNNQCYCYNFYYNKDICCSDSTYLNSNNQCVSCPTNSYVGLGNVIDANRFGKCVCSWNSFWDENSKSCIDYTY